MVEPWSMASAGSWRPTPAPASPNCCGPAWKSAPTPRWRLRRQAVTGLRCGREDLALPAAASPVPAVALWAEHARHHGPPAAGHGAGAAHATVLQPAHAGRARGLRVGDADRPADRDLDRPLLLLLQP